jgi:penicillin G amidase
MKLSPLTRRVLHFTIALLVAIGVLYTAAFSTGPLPPLGKALNAGKGIWTDASAALPVQNETLHLSGLQRPVTVIFERDGTAHIQAATDHDLFWTIGYLHARFRLTQMDLERRQGEGRLAEILGSQALPSDQFELMLGLQRTAEAEWQALPANSPIRQILLDYADGVNARISEEEQSGTLPYIFKLLNYQPGLWTPVDTLVVQGDLIQTQDFSTTPLQIAELVKALGYQRVMQWFPVLPPDAQHPYDTGPYAKAAAPAPLPAQLTISQSTVTMSSIASLEALLQQLPSNALRHGGESNNWAVNGSKAANGKAIMAGDPHLQLTLPAIWFQIAGTSPGYNFSGVSVPGIPTILIGHNQHISWSMTDVQNQSTLYYVEKTDKAHPQQYFWDGAWRKMQRISYDIPVLDAAPVHYDVYLTVHGPIMQPDKLLPGQTIAVDWIGALPTDDGAALMEIIHASTFPQFKAALSNWKAPTLNFVYADDQGNIGMISPGYYPIVRSGSPWLPLPGTGEADVTGSIPYSAVPQVYDPPAHMVFSANQRPVSNTYPYYIGTTLNDFDNGYRADEIYSVLSSGSSFTMQDMEQLQTSTHDYLASLIVPQLLATLQQASLNSSQQQALSLLEGWNDNMDANSVAASIWWTFWNRYLTDAFQPWWNAYHVPVSKDQSLEVSPDQTSLDEDLESWTLHDQHNPAFTPPKAATRDAALVMLQAFKESVSMLGKALGSNPRQWDWDKLHTRSIVSLLGVEGLSYGPRGSGGDSWTTNAAGTDPLSANDPAQQIATAGPSWRMIVDWGNGQAVSVYPGGQDENPASSWYENEIAAWWNGQYYPMLDGAQARQQAGSVIWTLDN